MGNRWKEAEAGVCLWKILPKHIDDIIYIYIYINLLGIVTNLKIVVKILLTTTKTTLKIKNF